MIQDGEIADLSTWVKLGISSKHGGMVLSEYIIFGENNHKWDNDGFFFYMSDQFMCTNKIFFKSCSHFALQVKRCCAFMNLYETFCEESHNYIGSLLRSL